MQSGNVFSVDFRFIFHFIHKKLLIESMKNDIIKDDFYFITQKMKGQTDVITYQYL